MRIISDFKDYYDVVQKHGVGEPLYIRKSESVSNKQTKELFALLSHIHRGMISISRYFFLAGLGGISYGFIIFCGKVYRYVKITVEHSEKLYAKSVYGEIYCYDIDKAMATIREKASGYRSRFDERTFDEQKKLLETFFSASQAIDANKIHAVHNAPIIDLWFNYWREEAVTNPSLREKQFNTVLDPYTAFQELSMYVGGVLPKGSNKVIDIVDDKVKAEKHGFDKHSFRKDPETVGKRRKKV